MKVHTETLVSEKNPGKVHVQGYVDDKIIYSSKAVNPGNITSKLSQRWERRVKKQLAGGRKFN